MAVLVNDQIDMASSGQKKQNLELKDLLVESSCRKWSREDKESESKENEGIVGE
jgi:hypothetical protein